MEISDAVDIVERAAVFTEWCSTNKSGYLVHLFRMYDKANAGIWQVGYYDPESDRITTFILADGDVQAMPESEVFKKTDDKVAKLDLDAVKIDIGEAIEKAEALRNEKYPSELPMKKMVILQHLDEGQVYNITFITQGFNVLNIRVSSADGSVLSHKLASIMDFRAEQ